ncbi:hypothetical protein WN943_018689 [Citrus x changshan-huyou]
MQCLVDLTRIVRIKGYGFKYKRFVAAAARSQLLHLLSSLSICSNYFQSVAVAAALPSVAAAARSRLLQLLSSLALCSSYACLLQSALPLACCNHSLGAIFAPSLTAFGPSEFEFPLEYIDLHFIDICCKQLL